MYDIHNYVPCRPLPRRTVFLGQVKGVNLCTTLLKNVGGTIAISIWVGT